MRTWLGTTVLLTAALGLLGATALPATAAVHHCAGKRVTILGTGGDDVIRGTRGDDVIDGRAGSDVINGLQGDDVICGNYGADDLRGNAGDDRLYGGPDAIYGNGAETWYKTGDTLRGGPGDDTLVPGVDDRGGWNVDPQPDVLRFDSAPRGVQVHLGAGRATGEGADRIAVNGPVEVWTTRFADRVVGSPYDDTIRSGPGPDRVWAAAGRDVVDVDSGPADASSDVAWGGPGPDLVFGGGGDDRLVGGPGDDRIGDSGERSSDVLEGGAGDDELGDTGVSGTDELHGQDGDDWIRDDLPGGGAPIGGALTGGTGVDWLRFRLVAPAPGLHLDLDSGTLQVQGTATSVEVGGFELHTHEDSSPLRVTGSPGADRVHGSGPVTMEGRGGDDALSGTEGDDTFDGGLGSDCFEQSASTTDSDTLVDVEIVRTRPDSCPWP